MDSNEGGELSYRAISIWARSSTFLAAKWSQPVQRPLSYTILHRQARISIPSSTFINGGRFQQNIRGVNSYIYLPRRHISRSLIPSLANQSSRHRYAIRFIGRTSYPRHWWPNHREHFPGPGTLRRTWSMCTISYRANSIAMRRLTSNIANNLSM